MVRHGQWHYAGYWLRGTVFQYRPSHLIDVTSRHHAMVEHIGASPTRNRYVGTASDPRVEGLKEVEHFSEIIGAEDRKRTVPDEQVRADRRDAVDVSWYRVDGHAVVEGDPRGDQRTALDSSLDDKQDITEPSNHAIPGPNSTGCEVRESEQTNQTP
jgi:hypothetical protein